MPASTISQVYKQRERSLVKGLKKVRDLESRSIHQLRLDIKNIRALLGLRDAMTEERPAGKALLALLKPLFKHAGKLRTAGLNIEQTRAYRSAVLVKFKGQLKKQAEKSGSGLQKAIKRLDMKALEKLHKKNLRALKAVDDEQLGDEAVAYLRERLGVVRAEIFDVTSDEKLHAVRRQLKTVRNIAHLLEEAAVDYSFKNELKKLGVTYEKIGKWHDRADLIVALENFVDGLDDAKSLATAGPILLKLKQQNLRMRRNIARRLRVDLVK